MATRKIAILTSGGDAPGMNAAIRAAARTGIAKGWEIFGVRDGYAGLVAGLDRAARRARRGRHPAARRHLPGQRALARVQGRADPRARPRQPARPRHRRPRRDRRQRIAVRRAVAVADGASRSSASRRRSTTTSRGSEITIGVDTALNIALEAIDRLKVTASSHQRAFLVEVMGRNCGYLALMAGIAGGAESVVIPEAEVEPEVIARDIQSAYDRGKAHALVVVAEGARNNATRLAGALRGAPGAAGIRPARDDARSRPARRNAGRLRSPAGHAPRGRRHRTSGPRRARAIDGSGAEARSARRRSARWSACPRSSTSACSSCRRCSRSDRGPARRAAGRAAREPRRHRRRFAALPPVRGQLRPVGSLGDPLRRGRPADDRTAGDFISLWWPGLAARDRTSSRPSRCCRSG